MYNDGVITTEFTGGVVSGTFEYPTAEQNAVITFGDFYLSGRDGDFTTDGISVQYMTGESEDLTIGNAPSAVINATMMNPDGAMDRLTWGYGTAYIGVVTASAQADKYSSWPCYVNVNGTRFGIYNSRMYRGTSYSALTGEPVAVIVTSDGKATYITDTKIGYYNGSSFSTVADPSPAQAYLAAKCRRYVNPLGIGLDANGCPAVFNDVSGNTKKTFTYIPMGVYDFSGVDAYGIAFCAEAYDKMTLFDADATDWVQTLDFSTPKTLSTLIGELMTEMGLSCNIPASAVNTGVPLSVNPVTSYSVTYRQILKWLAQAIGCNARMSRTGAVEFVTYSATPVGNAIRPDTIVSGGRTKTRYSIPGINQVICYNAVGAGFEYHDPTLPPDTEMVPLYIIANPFVDPSASSMTIEDLCGLVNDIPGYYPTTLNVVCSDPRIDAGDFVTVYNTDSATTYNIPVMTQTIYWSNACRTQYVATGNQVRQIPDAITDCADLSGVVSSNPTAVVNMIQAHGIDADWITAGIIRDRQGNNSWDLDTGVLSMKSGALNTVYTLTYEAANYDQSDLDTVDDYLNGAITSLTTEEWEKYDFLGTRHLTNWNRNHIAQMIATGTDVVKTVTTNIDPHSSDNSVYSSIKVSAVGTSPQYTINGSLSAARLGATTTRSSYVDVFNGVTVHSDSYSGGRYNTYVQQNYIGLTDSTTTNAVTIRTDKMSATDGTNTTSLTGANATSTDGTNMATMAPTGATVTDGTNTSSTLADRFTVTDGTNTTTQTATGTTYNDGVASSKLAVIKRTLDAADTTTVTLDNGVYLAVVTHTNNSTTTQQGLYVVQCYNTSCILTIAAAANSTLSISGHTLTWTTTNTYRALRLIKLT